MFKLNETITTFNRIYDTKIKSNKTWGLVYLQPKSLAFLNQYMQLIQESVYYASSFVTDRKALRAALARAKEQSLSELLPILQNITQQLKMDQSILQRLNWEENLSVRLNNNDFWEEHFNQADTHSRIQCYLMQLQAQWNTHRPFQYHSSQGLLFLLDVVIEYQHHFTRAKKELQKKQATWLTIFRLPNAIAKGYQLFLTDQLNYLKSLQGQVLEALLLRLKIAEQQNQITCDDVSYFLAQETQRLGSSTASLSLPERQMLLDTPTFNKIHRAIEKHGNTKQKKRLYQLAWYDYKAFNSEDLTVITVSQQRLLLPKALLSFFPKKYRKFMGLFTNNTKHLEFLETQQALLSQLALSLNFANLPLESVSITHPTLRSLTTRYQLLQQALQSVDQPPICWWQWQKKRWRKAWQAWLVEQLQKNQASLSACLGNFYQQVQSREDLLSQAAFCEKLQSIIQAIQTLVHNDPPKHPNTLLTAILKRLSVLLQKNNRQTRSTSDALLHSFRRDLSTVLKSYIQYYHNRGETIPDDRRSDFYYLWNLLRSSKDAVQLREEFNQRYQAMQPALFKLIPALDYSFLRRSLKTVLENPKYSMDQFKLAELPQTKQNKFQKSNTVSAAPLPTSSLENLENTTLTKPFIVVSDMSNLEQLTTEEAIDQLEKRIRVLIKTRECSHSFFRKIPKNGIENDLNYFKSLRSMA